MAAELTRRKVIALASAALSVASLPLTSASAFAGQRSHRSRARHPHHNACATPSAFHVRHHGPGPIAPAVPNVDERRISFFNIHTNETINIAYWRHGQYQPDALHRIAIFMRDYRNGEVHAIDPHLLDLLQTLHTTLRTSEPFNLISGYRSPQTNARLVALDGGVATHSLHMQGMAADIQLSDRSLTSLRNAALYLSRGGVGYYPRSNFVHVDVGRVRQWQYG